MKLHIISGRYVINMVSYSCDLQCVCDEGTMADIPFCHLMLRAVSNESHSDRNLERMRG